MCTVSRVDRGECPLSGVVSILYFYFLYFAVFSLYFVLVFFVSCICIFRILYLWFWPCVHCREWIGVSVRLRQESSDDLSIPTLPAFSACETSSFVFVFGRITRFHAQILCFFVFVYFVFDTFLQHIGLRPATED